MPHIPRGFSAIHGALFRPDRAFAGHDVYRLPKLILVLGLFLLYVTGERFVQGYYQNSHAKTLAILEVDTRMSGFIQNAPPEAQARMRAQMLDSILGRQSGMMTAVSIAFSGVGFLLLVAETWLVSIVVSQFFGGQEERHGRDRPSWTLFLLAFLPLAIRKLLAGALMTLRNPDVAANALTFADYRRLSTVRFDFFSLLTTAGLPAFPAALARFLTDPFFLWTLAILCFGGREVFRIPLRSTVLMSLVLVVALSLQAALFARIGLTWEI
jgi:hypothetical protein